jgi:hypothetical protein
MLEGAHILYMRVLFRTSRRTQAETISFALAGVVS